VLLNNIEGVLARIEDSIKAIENKHIPHPPLSRGEEKKGYVPLVPSIKGLGVQ